FAQLLEGNLTENVSIKLKPTLSANDILVTLDYNYDSKTEDVYVKFNQSYNAAQNWEETPTREGYDFAGWWTSNGLENEGDWGTQVLGSDVKDDTNAQTLYAKWNLSSFSIKLVANNSTISNVEGATLVQNGNEWSANSVDYLAQISFKLTAMQGYKISQSGWDDCFVVVVNSDETADITLTMPAYDFEYTLLVAEDLNSLNIKTINIKAISYQIKNGDDIESEDTIAFEDSESECSIEIETARTLVLTLEMFEGYTLKDENVLYDGGLDLSFEYDENQYVTKIVVDGINSSSQIQLTATERQNKVKVEFDDVSRISLARTSEGQEFENVTGPIELEVTTGEEIYVYFKYVRGYVYDYCSSEDYTIELSDGTGAYENYAVLKISDISKDGNVLIVSKKLSYKVVGKSISYDSTGEEVLIDENIVYLSLGNYEYQESVSAQIGDIISLNFVKESTYTFAGWSIDGRNVLSTVESYSYLITEQDIENANEDAEIYIYGIFSKLQYNVSFATLNSYTVYEEYQDSSKVQTIYKK
ncbi:MAG: InlB B-repeat-containing protein, partial [Clostridia bacterium]|nr:InlB B-repeat-containing protein [Clostridia bacterium]